MNLLARHPWLLVTALLVPLLTLASPGWLKLSGVAPAWAVIWLLPWALVDGRRSGAIAGLALGLALDSLHPGLISQIPALTLLGWWWGRLGREAPPIERSFNLGLLALLGTLVLNLSLMAQWGLGGGRPRANLDIDPAWLAQPGWQWRELADAGLQVLMAQTLLTALLAPVLCSLLLLLLRHQAGAGWRG